MAIDAKLLVLDEPTLGLDILYRKQFYQNLLEDYFDENKTILITTHQIEEVEHILTDLMFIANGKISLAASMDEVGERFTEVMVEPQFMAAANALQPLSQRTVFGKAVMLFDGVHRQQLSNFGELRTPSVADLFVATMKGTTHENHEMADQARNVGKQGHAVVDAGGDRLRGGVLVLTSLFLGKMSGIQVEGHNIGTVTIEGAARMRIAETCRRLHRRRHAGIDGAGLPGVLLLPGRAARRTPRPQPAVLEIAAGFGLHHRDVQAAAGGGGGAADHDGHRHRAGPGGAGCRLHHAADAWHQLFGAVLASPDLYLTPLRLIGLLPVYILWALPTVGWLLMVSSMARSKVFLWAVGTPVITSLLLLWAEKVLHSASMPAGSPATSPTASCWAWCRVPGWYSARTPSPSNTKNTRWHCRMPFQRLVVDLGGSSVWIGVAAGVAMIAVAITMRRRREV
jgi:hypothetical protein